MNCRSQQPLTAPPLGHRLSRAPFFSIQPMAGKEPAPPMARAIAAFIHLVCLLAALSLLQVSPARAEGGDLAHTMKLAISCNPQIAAAVQRYKAAQAE